MSHALTLDAPRAAPRLQTDPVRVRRWLGAAALVALAVSTATLPSRLDAATADRAAVAPAAASVPVAAKAATKAATKAPRPPRDRRTPATVRSGDRGRVERKTAARRKHSAARRAVAPHGRPRRRSPGGGPLEPG